MTYDTTERRHHGRYIPGNLLSLEAQKHILDMFAPLMDQMTKEAQSEIDSFDAAFSADHNAIGRILRVHLVIKQYINEHITTEYKINNLGNFCKTLAPPTGAWL